MKNQRFADKVAIVTGAAQGIGRATALRLASEGAHVVLVDVALSQCMTVKAEIENDAGSASVIQADLETFDGAQAMVEHTLSLAKRIDISVHNVGGSIWFKPFWEYAPAEIEKEISRSLWPALWCCRAVVPVMRAQGGGAIVNVGSAVTRGGFYRVPYAAAKGGVHAMTTCIANELGESGVRVNCVAPGGVDNADRRIPRNPKPLSPQEKRWLEEMYARSLNDTALRRLATADEIAAAICFLAADESSYVTGQLLSVAGGVIA